MCSESLNNIFKRVISGKAIVTRVKIYKALLLIRIKNFNVLLIFQLCSKKGKSTKKPDVQIG